jgi:hypothetical protein
VGKLGREEIVASPLGGKKLASPSLGNKNAASPSLGSKQSGSSPEGKQNIPAIGAEQNMVAAAASGEKQFSSSKELDQ